MDTETTETTVENSSTVEQKTGTTVKDSSTVEQKTDSSAEKTAYKELYEAQQKKVEELQNEITVLKVSNAKLAIQQSASIPQQSCEELLNKMF